MDIFAQNVSSPSFLVIRTLNLLSTYGFLARDCHEGIRTCDLWVSVTCCGHPPCFCVLHSLCAYLIAGFLVSIAAQVRFLACPVQRQPLQGGTRSCCCHPPHFCVQHAYVLTCLQDSWPGSVMKGF